MDVLQDTDQLLDALAKFHEKSNLVKATKENPFLKNKYADFAMIVTNTRPALVEYGLQVKQLLTHIDGKTAVWTALIHKESKQFMTSVTPVVHKDNDAQSQGSGITYTKRYAYVAILDLIVDKDDDGNIASGLKKVSETSKEVDKAINKLNATKSSEELKSVFISLGSIMHDQRVISAKDAKKMEFQE